MNKNIDQITGYARLIVRELHQVVMDETVWEKMKTVLQLTEELEFYLEGLTVKQQAQESNNILQFRRKLA